MDIISSKPLFWLGSSQEDLRGFPSAAQRVTGYQLRKVQEGQQPSDCKPIATIGKGVEEIRIWVESGTYRVIYIARLEEAVYVLHAFKKTTEQTSERDLRLAKNRLEQLLRKRESAKAKKNS